jgi:hypothetical protein
VLAQQTPLLFHGVGFLPNEVAAPAGFLLRHLGKKGRLESSPGTKKVCGPRLIIDFPVTALPNYFEGFGLSVIAYHGQDGRSKIEQRFPDSLCSLDVDVHFMRCHCHVDHQLSLHCSQVSGRVVSPMNLFLALSPLCLS